MHTRETSLVKGCWAGVWQAVVKVTGWGRGGGL